MIGREPNAWSDIRLDLAETLRATTWPHHRAVEANAFVRALLKGELDGRSYCLMLRSLHDIYAALEAALDQQSGHPVLCVTRDARLRRTAHLVDDLQVLHGKHWAIELTAQPAAEEYAHRLAWLARTRPELLLAHAYVRYLGDLSGGQAIQRVVNRALGLRDGQGARFHDFGNRDEVAELAREFRAGLAAVNDADASHADIAREATWAFDIHARLFNELELSRAGN
jgi:heme oxygenase